MAFWRGTRGLAAALLCAALVLAARPAGAQPREPSLPPAAQPSPAAPEPALLLPALLAEARRVSPELREAAAAQEMARAGVPQAGAWPEPTFMVGYRNNGLRLSLGADPFSNLVLSLSQQFPFPGKLGLRQEVARREVERTEAEAAARQLALDAMLKEAYYELFYVDRAADATRATGDLLRRMAKLATDRYRIGQGGQAEVIRAQIAVTRSIQETIQLGQQIAGLEATLNRLLARPPGTPLGRPVAPAMEHRAMDLAALLALAEARSARLQVADREQARAQAALAAARRDYFPDLTVTAALMPRGAMAAMWELDLSLNLPLFFAARQDAAVRELAAGVNRAVARRDIERQALGALLADRLARLESTMRLEELYRTVLLPQARAALRAATAAYGAGKFDLLGLLESATAILAYEKEHARAIVDHHHALTHIEEAVGGPLDVP